MGKQVASVVVVADDLTVSGYAVELMMHPEGRDSFVVVDSSVWLSVIGWLQRSGFDGVLSVSRLRRADRFNG